MFLKSLLFGFKLEAFCSGVVGFQFSFLVFGFKSEVSFLSGLEGSGFIHSRFMTFGPRF